MRDDLKGAEHQRVALQEPPRARRQRAAVFRADGAGPNHVEVPRKRRVVPAPDGPARVADGQAAGRALRGAPPHAGGFGGAALPVLGLQQLGARGP